MYARSPGLMLLGLIPAMISFAVLVAAFVAMVYFVDDLVTWATPFADDWPVRRATRRGLWSRSGSPRSWVMLSVLAFAALTLLIGQPFYEAISKRVEDDSVGCRARSTCRSGSRCRVRSFDSIRLALFAPRSSLCCVFLLALLPVVGRSRAPYFKRCSAAGC